MKFIAVYIIPGTNTFVRLPVENHDESKNFIEEDAKTLGKRLGLNFLYLEDAKP